MKHLMLAVFIFAAVFMAACSSDSPTSLSADGPSPDKAGGNGLEYTLVPNGYDGSYWQSEGGEGAVTLWEAVNEVAEDTSDLDDYYVTQYLGPIYGLASFQFTDVSNPHPAALITDLTLRFWIERIESSSALDVELWLDGSLAGTVYVPIYDAGIHEESVTFNNLGSLSKVNSMVVKFRSYDTVHVHALNVPLLAYVPADRPKPRFE